MKPRIAIFGLPKLTAGEISIWIYKNPTNGHYGEEVYNAKNDDSEMIFDFAHSEIELGDEITFVMRSSGICEYTFKTTYKGTDISHVANFEKEKNTSDNEVSIDWNPEEWKQWIPAESAKAGSEKEKSYLLSRKLSVAPIWESYYAESRLDYLEKFHKLWIGLNSFASQFSTETRDKNKILALVNSPLRNKFNSELDSLSNLPTEQKLRDLMQATGVNMTSDIVRDEINKPNDALEFLELSKKASGLFSDIAIELEGIVFLDKDEGEDVFQDIFSRYHQFMASPQGMTETFTLSNAFTSPKSPESVTRIGRLVFHNPFNDNADGTLFKLEDFFGLNYGTNPYGGQTPANQRAWEMVDPLFFKYLLIMYKFRCAYFHGDLSPNRQNDELAKSAYQSLYGLFSSII